MSSGVQYLFDAPPEGGTIVFDNTTVDFGNTTGGLIGYGLGYNSADPLHKTGLTLGSNLVVTGKNVNFGRGISDGPYAVLTNNAYLHSQEGGQYVVQANNFINSGTLKATGGIFSENAIYSPSSFIVLTKGTFSNTGRIEVSGGVYGNDGGFAPASFMIYPNYEFSNSGTMVASNRGQLTINADLTPVERTSSVGKIRAESGGRVNLELTLLTSALSDVRATTGGMVQLKGWFYNTGNTFNPEIITGTANDPDRGTLSLFGRLVGGVLSHADNIVWNYDAWLEGVTITDTNALFIGTTPGSSARLILTADTKYTPGLTFHLGGAGSGALELVSPTGTEAVLDNAHIIFGDSGSVESENKLRLGSHLDLQGKNGYLRATGKGLVNDTALTSDEGGIWRFRSESLTNNGLLCADGIDSAFYAQFEKGFENTGQIIARNGGFVQLEHGLNGYAPSPTTDLGVATAQTGGTLQIQGQYTTSALAKVQVQSGGKLILVGSFDNRNATLDVANLLETGGNSGQVSVGATISGGTLLNADKIHWLDHTYTNDGSVLDGVTLNSGLNISTEDFDLENAPAWESVVRIRNGGIVAKGAIFHVGTGTNNRGELQFDATTKTPHVLFDDATVYLGNSLHSGVLGFGKGFTNPYLGLEYVPGATLTLGSNLNIQGQNVVVGDDSWGETGILINKASLVSDEAGGWRIGAADLRNEGTIAARNHSSIGVYATNSFLNTGTLLVGDDSILELGTQWNKSAPQNSGTIQVGENAIFRVGRELVQAGEATAQTLVNGLLSLDYGTQTLTIDDGMLSGGGTIEGNVVSNAQLTPGASLGTLTITGNLALLSQSILTIEIGGMGAGQYDSLAVNGNTSLGGELIVEFLDGVQPQLGDTWEFLSASAITSSFDRVTVHGSNINIAVFGGKIVVVPESNTFLFLAITVLMVLGANFVQRKQFVKYRCFPGFIKDAKQSR